MKNQSFEEAGLVGFEIVAPSDFHVHLRDETLLRWVIGYTARHFSKGYVLAMPNLQPPILTAKDAQAYFERIIRAADAESCWLKPTMTIQITPETTAEIIREAASTIPIIAGKIYPKNLTTHSEFGVTDYLALTPVYEAMQEVGMVLSLHPEDPNPEVEGIKKEESFLRIAEQIHHRFPQLKIVLEHITTKSAVNFLKSHAGGMIAATVTAHHLVLTLDDVLGYSERSGFKMRPHNFCKTVPGSKEDRQALIEAATSSDERFFFGSDSAPHTTDVKHSDGIPPGIFSAPVALAVVAEVFEKAGRLDNLERFLSRNGPSFYNLAVPQNSLRFVRREWIVPRVSRSFNNATAGISYSLIPFLAGETLLWQLEG